jgi:hypothetical protein
MVIHAAVGVITNSTQLNTFVGDNTNKGEATVSKTNYSSYWNAK